MINECADLIAIPTTRIINISLQSKRWPAPWRTETQTPLPKKTKPVSYDDLRNVSCTNYLSKVMESYVLEKLQDEVTLKFNQFGGIKRTGTNHFLVETYNKIIECLEDGKSAVSILSVDFSKAFNRMSHKVCLQELAKRGASTDSLQMTAAFLMGRCMRVKVSGTKSTPRPVHGGSPQGTRIGNFLFTEAIEAIEEKGESLSRIIPPSIETTRGEERPIRMKKLAAIDLIFNNEEITASTPIKKGTWDGTLRYHDESGRDRDTSLVTPLPSPPPEWEKFPTWTDKYVDDANVGEHHYAKQATTLVSTRKEKRTIHATGCEALFTTIKNNAESVGMRVNNSKTQLLCIHPNPNIETESYINADDMQITSQKSLKILGFVFSYDGGMEENTKAIAKSYYSRLWRLRHLKKNKIPHKDLVKIYTTILRPVLEYAAVIYHHLLTSEQSEQIERMQRTAMNIIFGPSTSYRDALHRSGLPRLSERRSELFGKFALKTFNNPRYSHWFAPAPNKNHDLRKKPKILKKKPKTDRMIKNPMYQMIEYINNEM